MKRYTIGCPITLGEFERVTKNLEVYKQLNNEQKEWLDYYSDKNNYNFKDFVLKLDEDSILWVIINTGNSVKEFEE